MTTQRKLSPALISLIVVALLVLAGGAVYALTPRPTDSGTAPDASQTDTPDDTSGSQTTPGSSETATDSASSYQDGTYTKTGTYATPGGTESVSVRATLANGIITDVSTDGSTDRGTSREYQAQFLSAYKSQVVGKNIDEVTLSRVSGSSLTSNGFNRAIEQIKADAEA